MASCAFAADSIVSLAGQWRFALDRQDAGLREAWFQHDLPDSIRLPGTLTGQGIGDDVGTNTPWVGGIVDDSFLTAPEYAKYREPGKMKVPCWLQPEEYYAGAAWFQRDIDIPTNWSGRRVVVFLERAHWETQLWVDAKLVGTNRSLSTPHEYDLGQLAPGKHTLTVRVDNRRIVDIGENSHGISDHTQGNWNGIVGKIELRTTPLVWIKEVQVYPHTDTRSVTVKGKIGNSTGKEGAGKVRFAVAPRFAAVIKPAAEHESLVTWGREGGEFGVELNLEANEYLEFWSEFNPRAVWTLHADLERADPLRVLFGLKNISTDGTQFLINGSKTFFRGTLECAIFPKTGHPPMEVEEWRRIIRVAKSYGLNLLRFHSYCPPEAAFQAADELGMYLQVETCWPNQSTTIGDDKPVDQWVYEETDRILKYYGNHPSFVLMANGNEPGGKNHKAFLAKYVEHYKAKDPRRLWTSGSGWPELPENQFHVSPRPRVQQWGEGLKSRINARAPETTTDYREFIGKRAVPVISHEIGQWCAYPNFDEIPKYTGYLKPRNFEIFRERLDANGMGGLAKQFLLASGKLQTLCYKEEIESALRTPGMGGFQLLDLHDFPGQGTALVGVLDPFWEEKGYVTAAEYSRFCNSTVPLARLKKRVFTTDETLEAELEVAHSGGVTIEAALLNWHIANEGYASVGSGYVRLGKLPSGGNVSAGSIRVPLNRSPAPARFKLHVGLDGKGGPGRKVFASNDWDIWVYPAKPATKPAPDILVTAKFDDAAQAHLAAGGKLLLTIPGKQVRNFDKDPVVPGFSSIFWNTAWTKRQPPTTLGILCDPQHPALAEFPTELHSNWQWWYLIHRAGALRMDLLPAGVQPIVRVIDDWTTARPLGLVIEVKVGRGSAVICSFDLTEPDLDPVSRQMRTSLLAYMGGKKFAPVLAATANEVGQLFTAP